MAELITRRTLFADANLVAYWRLEDVSDSKGAFTLTNNATVSFIAAKYNNGATQGTSNSTKYLSVNNDLGITSGAISISLWVKMNTEPSSSTQSFFEHGDSGLDIRHWIEYIDTAGTKTLNFNRQRENAANEAFSATVTALGTSAFHHIAYTYDGSTIHGYLDGADIGSVAASGNGVSGVDIDYTYIGAHRTQTPTVTLHSSAVIDDVAVFSRVLTPAEVALIYKENRGNFFQVF